jgi:hypothetical protein
MTKNQRQIGEAFIAERLNTPFRWGGHDCGLFVADFLLATTGVDFAEPVRGKYSDAGGALKTFQAIPAEGLAEFMRWTAIRFHWVVVTAETAEWGDVGILRNRRESACICIGPGIIAAGQKRLITKPRALASQLWRVT